MVYEGTLKFLKTAHLFKEKGQNDKASVYVMKASSAIIELMGTLDHTVAPEFADSLEKLYLYILEGLRLSLEKEGTNEIQEAIDMVSNLKGAWEEAFAAQASEAIKVSTN